MTTVKCMKPSCGGLNEYKRHKIHPPSSTELPTLIQPSCHVRLYQKTGSARNTSRHPGSHLVFWLLYDRDGSLLRASDVCPVACRQASSIRYPRCSINLDDPVPGPAMAAQVGRACARSTEIGRARAIPVVHRRYPFLLRPLQV